MPFGASMKDTAPRIQRAGVTTTNLKETAGDCLNEAANSIGRPTTPPHLRPFRQTARLPVGERPADRLHQAAPAAAIENVHGVRNVYGPNAGASVNPNPDTWTQDQLNDMKESTYRRNRFQPLGKTFTRPYKYPDVIKEGGGPNSFCFGNKIDRSEDAGRIIHPKDPIAEDGEDVRAMYKRTHHAYDPGEQMRRGIVSPDQMDSRHGVSANKTLDDTAKACLSWKGELGNDPSKTTIVAASVQAERELRGNRLGVPRNYGVGAVTNDNMDRVFGMASNMTEYVNAGDCIRGWYSEEEQLPDTDLGKSRLHASADPDRRYGVSTLRTDISAPAVRSVGDMRNYGNEPDARGVLFPSKYADNGVFEEDFLQKRSRSDLKEILRAAGYEFDDSDYDNLYNIAWQKLHGSGDVDDARGVSVEAFRRVLVSENIF